MFKLARIVLALTLLVSLPGATVPAAADYEETSHGVRFTDSSETPKALGFLVPEGELGAVAAGSVNHSQGGPDLVYFSPGGHLIWYASGILWVGGSESVAAAVDAERQRLAMIGLALRDVTHWPATLDGQTPQQQDLKGVQQRFAQAHGENWPFVWQNQHNEELILQREQVAVAAARPALMPAPGPERHTTGDGKTLGFPAGAQVLGAHIRLEDGRECILCFLHRTPKPGNVTSGVIGAFFPGELARLTEWKP